VEAPLEEADEFLADPVNRGVVRDAGVAKAVPVLGVVQAHSKARIDLLQLDDEGLREPSHASNVAVDRACISSSPAPLDGLAAASALAGASVAATEDDTAARHCSMIVLKIASSPSCWQAIPVVPHGRSQRA
jgi:hypothetical protein